MWIDYIFIGNNLLEMVIDKLSKNNKARIHFIRRCVVI